MQSLSTQDAHICRNMCRLMIGLVVVDLCVWIVFSVQRYFFFLCVRQPTVFIFGSRAWLSHCWTFCVSVIFSPAMLIASHSSGFSIGSRSYSPGETKAVGQADMEQMGWWLPRALNFQMVGCYAQTELGHGSNGMWGCLVACSSVLGFFLFWVRVFPRWSVHSCFRFSDALNARRENDIFPPVAESSYHAHWLGCC